MPICRNMFPFAALFLLAFSFDALHAEDEPPPKIDLERLKQIQADLKKVENEFNTPEMRLMMAINKNKLDEVEKLLAENPGVANAKILNETITALQFAIKKGNKEVIKALLDHKADPNGTVPHFDPPLLSAISAKDKELVALLLEYKADPNARDFLGKSALQVAQTEELKDLLRKAGAKEPPAVRQEDQPLFELAYKGEVKALEAALREHPEAIQAHKATSGFTLLHSAAIGRQKEVVLMLLEHHADPNLQDRHGSTPLHVAAGEDQVEIIELLMKYGAQLDAKDQIDCTPLREAVEFGRVKAVRVLLDLKADPNTKDRSGETPLHWASAHGYANLVTLLLDANAAIDARNIQDATPLFVAAKEGQKEIVQVLLERKANPKLTSEGRSPLEVTYNLEIQELLRKAGATGNPPDPAQADPRDAVRRGDLALLKEILKANPGADKATEERPYTLLYVAVMSGNADIAALLLENKADPNSVNLEGATPLHLAAAMGKEKLVDLLLKFHAEPGITDKNGRTALLMAASMNMKSAVKQMLELKANPNLKDKDGKTALQYTNDAEIKELLIKAGAKE